MSPPEVQLASVHRMQVAGHIGSPYSVQKNVVSFIAVVSGEVNKVPSFFTLSRTNLLGVDNRNVEHGSTVQIFFRVDQITGCPEISYAIA